MPTHMLSHFRKNTVMDEYLVQLYKLCEYVADSHSAGCLVVFSNMEMYANEDLCSFCQLNV